jgi:hypothetical protein
LRCGLASCPSVTAVAGDLLIVGKRGDQLATDLDIGVGPDEYAIVIERGLLDEVLKCQANDSEKGTGSAPTAFQSDGSGDAALDAEIVRVHSMLLERLKLKYAGDCKCGNCQLVPADVIMNAANLISYSLPRSIDEGCKPDERTVDSAWRFDIENAPTDRPILAHDRMSLMQNVSRPMVLTWFKYNGLEAWRDWDGDAHTSVTRWMAIPEVRRQIEEAGLPADEWTAAGETASLTSISTPQEAPPGPGEGLSAIIEPQDG